MTKKLNPDNNSQMVAMRCLLTVQRKAKGDAFLMSEIAAQLMKDHGISRAQSFRLVRKAMDVLGISYHETPARLAHILELKCLGQAQRRSTQREAT